jgi:Uma2 family endonuclease
MATKAGITWEEFLAAGKEGRRWEYVDGQVVFMTPVFRPHGKTNVKLDYELVAFARQHPEWIAYGTDTAFTMASGNWRCPDAALVRKERDDAAAPPGTNTLRSRHCF